MIALKEIFLRDIKEHLENEEEAILNGAGDNYSEVQHLRGRIQGLKLSIQIFEEIVERIMRSEDLLDEE